MSPAGGVGAVRDGIAGRVLRVPRPAEAATTVLWAVSGSIQFADAVTVLSDPAFAGIRTALLDCSSLAVHRDLAPVTGYQGPHWVEQGFGRVLALRRLVEQLCPAVLVLGQDMSRPQRVLALRARQLGAQVVVVPDGLILSTVPRLERRAAVQERVLRLLRWSYGRARAFGGSRPDVWCAWGPGWVGAMSPLAGRVPVTGSARDDVLAALPSPPTDGYVLVCSQPLLSHPFTPDEAAAVAWYAWLETLAATAPAGALRVRLHPRERDTLATCGVGPRARAMMSTSSFEVDLAGARAVVSPLSTTLVEAAATGRRVLSTLPTAAGRAARLSSVATLDPRLVSVPVASVPDFASLVARLAHDDTAVTGWGRDFVLAAPGSAARIAIEVLAQLPTAPRAVGS